MNNNENKPKKEKKEKREGGFDRTRIMTVFGYIVLFGTSIVASLYNIGFDVNNILTSRFLGNLTLNYALAIVMLTLTMRDGDLHFRTKAGGAFQTALLALRQLVADLMMLGRSFVFGQYAKFKYQEKKNIFLTKKLDAVGLKDLNITRLTKEDLHKLLTVPMGREFTDIVNNVEVAKRYYFDVITKDQLEVVMDIKKGNFRFKEIHDSSILSEFSTSDLDMYQRVADGENYIRAMKRRSISQRLVMMGLMSALFTATIFVPSTSSQQAILDTVSRITNLVVAAVYGYITASTAVAIETSFLIYKGDYVRTFNSDMACGYFQAKTNDELVIEKLKQLEADYMDKKAKEAGIHIPPSTFITKPAEVVKPQIVPTNDELELLKLRRASEASKMNPIQ